MIHYNQHSRPWGDLYIANTSKMSMYGCFITSLAMLAYITPDVCLKKLKAGKGLSGDLVISTKAAEVLGLTYEGISVMRPDFVCIAEVDFKPETSKKDQHFVVFLPLGDGDKIIDPWDGKLKLATAYGNIVSYRRFHEAKPPVNTALDNSIKVLTDDLLEVVKVRLEQFRKDVIPK